MLAALISNRWAHSVLLLAVLACAVFLSFAQDRWREQIRNFTFDNYNLAFPRVPSDSVIIIDIDEASLQKIGQMPWPRSVMADLLERLKNAQAKVVAFDIVFAEPDRTSPRSIVQSLHDADVNQDLLNQISALPDHDTVFADSIKNAGNVITGFSFTNEKTNKVPTQKGIFRGQSIEHFIPRLSGATANLRDLERFAAGNGSFFVSTDTDGIIRRVPMLVAHAREGSGMTSIYPSLSLEVVRVIRGERGGRVMLANPAYAKLDPARFGITGIEIGNQPPIPTNARGEFLVYFSKSRKDWYVPAWQVLDGSYPSERLRDKIILVGTSAVGLKDIRSTPLDTFVPGVEVHLNIIDQILHGQYLSRSMEAEGLEAFAIIAAGLFIIIFAPFFGAVMQAAVVLATLIAGIYAGLSAFQQYGLLIDVTYPAFSVLALFMLSTVLTYLRAERERRQVRQAFGLYISPDFMKELTRHPDKLKLGGETRELTVMFTDIRKFTSISEGLGPQELIQMMNDFLTPMSDLVMQNRGTIDKYIGDAMMAFWNAPLDDVDHARHACLTALKMQECLTPINQKIKEQFGSSRPLLEIGIGLNTGPCAVGNMGSRQRFAYSALGDAVNLASRLEGQTKYYGVPIIVGEDTKDSAPSLAFLELDYIKVQGREDPVHIYALCGDENLARSDEFQVISERHHHMMTLYYEGKFKEAQDIILKGAPAKVEKMYDLFLQRTKEFIDNPPKDWSGVFEAKSK